MPEFERWSWTHLVVVVVTAVLVTGACLAGRALKRRDATLEHRWRWRVAWALLAVQVFKNAWWMWPTGFDIRESLPLQVCDLLELLVPLALMMESRLAWSVLWFLGVGLSTQAFITPVLTKGPGHVMFWLFWHAHASILAAAVYIVAVLGYRATLRDFGRLVPIGLAYVIAMMLVNRATSANYGFIGDHTLDGRPTLVDRLGPWPLRIVWLYLLANAALLMAWAPFPVARAIGSRYRGARDTR